MTAHPHDTSDTDSSQPALLRPYEEGQEEESFLDQAAREEFSSPDAPNSRVVEYWHHLVSDPRHLNELRGRVLVGVPNYVRGMVWKQLSEATLAISKNANFYSVLNSRPHAEFDEMIGNDVHRTFPNNPLFADDCYGQDALFRILRSYCHMNNDYSQCMSYLGAVLLMHMNEEDAFWTFVQMMKKYGLEAIFQRDLPTCLRNYSRFIAVSRPELFQHLTDEKLMVEIFVSGWLQTLFAQQFDLGLVFRLWDVFFTYGFIFLIKVSLVLLKHAEPTLLKMSNTEIIFNLKSLPTRVLDYDRLIEEAIALEIPEDILDASSEEERLLTITPTINFDVPAAAISPSIPRMSLQYSGTIDLRSSGSSGNGSISATPTLSSSIDESPTFRRTQSDSVPVEQSYNTPQSPQNTPPYGYIHKPLRTSLPISASPSSEKIATPALSASPLSKPTLM